MPRQTATDAALSFSPEAVHLQRRIGEGWQETDHVRFDGQDLKTGLARIRADLSDEAGAPSVLLVIPDDQLLYTRLRVEADGPAAMPAALADALEGLTPYAVADLAYDWLPAGPGEVHVAAVARQTLIEAADFAIRHGFAIRGFVADPDPERFPGEPEFALAPAPPVADDGDDEDAEAPASTINTARIAASIARLRALAAAHDAANGAAAAAVAKVSAGPVPGADPLPPALQSPLAEAGGETGAETVIAPLNGHVADGGDDTDADDPAGMVASEGVGQAAASTAVEGGIASNAADGAAVTDAATRTAPAEPAHHRGQGAKAAPVAADRAPAAADLVASGPAAAAGAVFITRIPPSLPYDEAVIAPPAAPTPPADPADAGPRIARLGGQRRAARERAAGERAAGERMADERAARAQVSTPVQAAAALIADDGAQAAIVRHDVPGDGGDRLPGPLLARLQARVTGRHGPLAAMLVLLVLGMAIIAMLAGGPRDADQAPVLADAVETTPATPAAGTGTGTEAGDVAAAAADHAVPDAARAADMVQAAADDALGQALREALGAQPDALAQPDGPAQADAPARVHAAAPPDSAADAVTPPDAVMGAAQVEPVSAPVPMPGTGAALPVGTVAPGDEVIAANPVGGVPAPAPATARPATAAADADAGAAAAVAGAVTDLPPTAQPGPDAPAIATGDAPTNDAPTAPAPPALLVDPAHSAPPAVTMQASASAPAPRASATAAAPVAAAAAPRPAAKPARAAIARTAAPDPAPQAQAPATPAPAPVARATPAPASAPTPTEARAPVPDRAIRPAPRPAEVASNATTRTGVAQPGAPRAEPGLHRSIRPPVRPRRSDAAWMVPSGPRDFASLWTPPGSDPAAFAIPARLAILDLPQSPAPRRFAQLRPARKPGDAASAIDAALQAAVHATPAAAASTVPAAGVQTRPARRPGGGVGAGAVGDGAVEQAIASAIQSSTVPAAPNSLVVPQALQASALPPRRAGAPVRATEAGIVTAAAPAIPPSTAQTAAAAQAAQDAAAEQRRRIEAELQAQAEARIRARADADTQVEARARAAAEARARAQAEAEERAARARGAAFRPAEIDDEPEPVGNSASTDSVVVAQNATIPGGLNLNRTTLIGVVGAGKASRGLIRLRNGRIVTVRIGDRINGGPITAISDGAVTYSVGGRARQLKILDGR